MYLTHMLKGFSLELGTGVRSQKTRMMGLPGGERSLTMSSAVWIQYTNVTDRQTDGRTLGVSKYRAYAMRRAIINNSNGAMSVHGTSYKEFKRRITRFISCRQNRKKRVYMTSNIA